MTTSVLSRCCGVLLWMAGILFRRLASLVLHREHDRVETARVLDLAPQAMHVLQTQSQHVGAAHF